jgi:hypothetical protein
MAPNFSQFFEDDLTAALEGIDEVIHSTFEFDEVDDEGHITVVVTIVLGDPDQRGEAPDKIDTASDGARY